jgi:hypothetical protein
LEELFLLDETQNNNLFFTVEVRRMLKDNLHLSDISEHVLRFYSDEVYTVIMCPDIKLEAK